METQSSLTSSDEFFYTIFEPKCINRFICRVKDKEGKEFIPAYLIKRFDRPSAVFNENGTWTWNPVEIEVYDPIVPSAAQIFAEYIRTENKIFDMQLDVMGPVGDIVEKWEFDEAKIIAVNFGTLDWESYPPDHKSKIEALNFTRYYKGGVPATIRITVEYKHAELIY